MSTQDLETLLRHAHDDVVRAIRAMREARVRQVLIAQMMQKYDTVGIDCVATNVNDICVGATPVSIVGTSPSSTQSGPARRTSIGLTEGAKVAGVSICGGRSRSCET